MNGIKDSLSPENIALNNVINKLQIYMEKNKQTLHGLATTMGFSYQPFYRLMTKKHLPTISSLSLIASHLNCSIAELTHNDVFIDISYYHTLSVNLDEESKKKCRIYIPYEQYYMYLNCHFFAIEYQNENIQYVTLADLDKMYQLFYSIDNISMDGLFLVNYNSQNVLINVMSASSKYVVVEENKKEHKIDIKLIKPIAKFFSYLELTKYNMNKVFGVRK